MPKLLNLKLIREFPFRSYDCHVHNHSIQSSHLNLTLAPTNGAELNPGVRFQDSLIPTSYSNLILTIYNIIHTEHSTKSNSTQHCSRITAYCNCGNCSALFNFVQWLLLFQLFYFQQAPLDMTSSTS